MQPSRDWTDQRLGRLLKLSDLMVLLTVVRRGTMGKAAAELSVSQPAISKAISEMEQVLGVRLLDRDRHGVTPTVFAHALLSRGAVAFDELRQALRDIEHLADPTTGEVRVGCSVILAMGFVSRIINELSRRHPRISFHVSAEESGATYRALEERSVDLAVVRLFKPISEPHLATEILYDEQHIVAAGVRNPLTRRRSMQLRDLVNEPWVLPPSDTLTGTIVREAFEANGLPVPQATVITSSTPARSALVAEGCALSILPASVLTLAGYGRAVKALPIKLKTLSRPVGIVTLENRMINPVARLFIDCARQVARGS